MTIRLILFVRFVTLNFDNQSNLEIVSTCRNCRNCTKLSKLDSTFRQFRHGETSFDISTFRQVLISTIRHWLVVFRQATLIRTHPEQPS